MAQRYVLFLALIAIILSQSLPPANNNNGYTNPNNTTKPNSTPTISTCPCIVGSANKWLNYNQNPNGIYVDVDISQYNLTKPPRVFTSLSGDAFHWQVSGVNSIYFLTNVGFRVYLRFTGGAYTNNLALTPDIAIKNNWYLHYHLIPQ